MVLNEDQRDAIAQCRLNDRLIPLSLLDEEQMAHVTQCRMNKAEVATVKFLDDPSMSISDENAFGTSLPGRNIRVIVQLPPSGNITCCSMQAFQRALSPSTIVPVIDVLLSPFPSSSIEETS
jgi:hypothetical protein